VGEAEDIPEEARGGFGALRQGKASGSFLKKR
jgi:hypothetical protein